MPAVRGLTDRLPFPDVRPGRPLAEIHAVSRPARAYSGDFYFTHRHDSAFWFAHGDVAGKGAAAAVVTAMIQEELEDRISSNDAPCDPSAAVARLDTFLRPLLPSNRFVTLVVGRLGEQGDVALTNAGHCPPIILRNDGSTELIDSTGPVVGLLTRAAWRSFVFHLQPGDSIILYSDGIIESTDDDDVELGVAVLREIVESSAGRTASDVASAILTRLEGRRHLDDSTLLVLRRV